MEICRRLKKRSLLKVNEHFSGKQSFKDGPLSQQNYSAQIRARLIIVFIARFIVVSDAYS